VIRDFAVDPAVLVNRTVFRLSKKHSRVRRTPDVAIFSGLDLLGCERSSPVVALSREDYALHL
jgi:hypothetical protein